MNKVILIGNLTRDPELSETNSGIAVCRFGLAVNRQYSSSDGERETDFFQVTAWRGTGENVARYCKKGHKVAVVGSIQMRNYEDRQGAAPPAIQQPREPVSQNSYLEQLKAENFSLREQLIAITKFALEMCDEDGCAGDESVGLPSCEMWKDYEDERGCVYCECSLKRFLEKLKGESNE